MKTELVIPVFITPTEVTPKVGGSPDAMSARRDATCARILKLLEKGPASAKYIAQVMKIRRQTSNRYLAHMRDELRQVRSIPAPDRRRGLVWIPADGDEQLTRDELIDRSFAPRRPFAPARQIGIPRDPLVAALFGPAA